MSEQDRPNHLLELAKAIREAQVEAGDDYMANGFDTSIRIIKELF